ncbi:MAG TPA: hypothetical protein VH396_21335 [Chitinophagaceae bacterium]
MRQRTFIQRTGLILWLQFAISHTIYAQQNNCTFKDPVVVIDFGAGKDVKDINQSPLAKYNRVLNKCPTDGNYAFASYTSDCFGGDWHTLVQDHTPNDKHGSMMLVNANETGGVFLSTTINGLKAKTTYQFKASMVNVCRISGTCPPLPANITIKLMTLSGRKVVSFQTGRLPQTSAPHWITYSGIFTTPEDGTTLILIMEDMTLGGCGNDFALDDIMLQECIKPQPVVKAETKPVSKPAKKRESAVTKKNPVRPEPVKKVSPVIISKKPGPDSPVISHSSIKEKPRAIPDLISTRENPLIKQIETKPGEIIIDLYDNGQIDGDTVSIYHNNELIVSRAGLSHQPVSFHIKVDTLHPHHELIMVANNLGSIPPNTSLMIITANDKRYEVFISSSEQKNAKIEIDLKE